MNNWLEQLAMGNYGVYVWSSFALVLGTLIALYGWIKWRLKKALNTQKHFQDEP